jgi:hypothetical protein
VPSVNVTVPDGAAVPEEGETVAVKVVLAVFAILTGLAVTFMVVARLTVTAAVPLEVPKEELPLKLAVTVLLPPAKDIPLTVNEAEPFASVPVPRFLVPRLKVTVPVGVTVPVVAFTNAVSLVLAELAMLAGLADRLVVVVVTVLAVTVTTVDEDEDVNALLPPYAAVIVLLPETRLAPLTERVAVETPLPATKVTVPSVWVPSEKVTLPVGAVVPVTGVMVAVTVVLEVFGMLAGLAAEVEVVPMLETTPVH